MLLRLLQPTTAWLAAAALDRGNGNTVLAAAATVVAPRYNNT